MGFTRLNQSTQQVDAMNDLKAVLVKHSDNLPSEVMLALVAQLVGCCVAMQDQRKMTGEMAVKIIQANMEEGNLAAISQLFPTVGNA